MVNRSIMEITILLMAIFARSALSGQAGDNCTWCDPPDLSCGTIPDIEGWKLVRALGYSKGTWFPNSDHLQGTNGYSDNGEDVYNIGNFETYVPGYNQFLFLTDHCQEWLIAAKTSIWSGSSYSNAQRTVCRSSEDPFNPTYPRWYNHVGRGCDPRISTIDYSSAYGASKILYAEDGCTGTWLNTFTDHGSIYIFIRNGGTLDYAGCSSSVHVGEEGDECEWCNATAADLSACNITDSENWTLVRAVGPSRNRWFPNWDSLDGTDRYADNGKDVYNIGNFANYVPGFNQFLMTTGDCREWLITSKSSVWSGSTYSYSERVVCRSSRAPHNPSYPRWYNRRNYCEPWISTGNYADAVIYGEETCTGNINLPKYYDGVYVYARNGSTLDPYGCSTSSNKGVAGDNCTWCDAPNLSSCGSLKDHEDWTLVRAIGSTHVRWFPNTDNLAGTDRYADNGEDVYNIGAFSDYVPNYNQFLFVTGNCANWLIAAKTSTDGYYNNYQRTVCRSSDYPNDHSNPRWYKRGSSCDPRISSTDYSNAYYNSRLLYGEDNCQVAHSSNTIANKGGLFVYIRNGGDLDYHGCSASVHEGVAGDDCTWCNDPVLRTCNNQLSDPLGWKLVRAIGSSRSKWYPNRDHLQGTDDYADNGVNIYNIGNFEEFVPGYNQFLFIDGGCSYYLLTSKQAIGTYGSYHNSDRQICESSLTPYYRSQRRWYHWYGSNYPYISINDWTSSYYTYYMMYMEGDYPSSSQYRGPNWRSYGLFVYIRNGGVLDYYGCQRRHYASNYQFPIISLGKAGDDCTWCTPPDLSSCGSINDPYNWKLVRAIGYQRTNNQRAFPNYDHLAGIDEYMDNGKDIYNIGRFETFVPGYNQFLITTGREVNCYQWLISSRSNIESYGRSSTYWRYVCRSSYRNYGYGAYWYQHYGSSAGPYISTYHWSTDDNSRKLLYAEGNYDYGIAYWGIYVFVRTVANLDGNGCCTESECKKTFTPTDDRMIIRSHDHMASGCEDVLLDKELVAFDEGADTIQDYEDYYGPVPVEMKNGKLYDSWIGWRVPYNGYNGDNYYDAFRSYKLNGSFTAFTAILGAPQVDGCRYLYCSTSTGCMNTYTYYYVTIKVDDVVKYSSGVVGYSETNINVDVEGAEVLTIQLSRYSDSWCDWIAFADPILHAQCTANYTDPLDDADDVAEIEITACDGWSYGSMTNALQMKLNGLTSSTPYFYVNEDSPLPTNGGTFTFFEGIPDIGDLTSVQIMVNDPNGFCIDHLTVVHNNGSDRHSFAPYYYFGSGIILSSECQYSYKTVQVNSPLLSCHVGQLELSVYRKRGIYQLQLHSCIGDQNGITATNMKNNVYTIIMGKSEGRGTYQTTTPSFLDHHTVGNIDMMTLGDLIAANVRIPESATNPLYSSTEGVLIGIKFELVVGDTETVKCSTAPPYIKVNSGSIKSIETDRRRLYRNCRYLIVFFDDDNRESIDKDDKLYIYGGSAANHTFNIYGIFQDGNYSLPFDIRSINSGINSIDANAKCQETTGTSLASIHTEETNFVLSGFLGDDYAWIGYKYYSLQSKSDWQWTDLSSKEYENWAPGQPNNAGNMFQDCTFMGKSGGWFDSDCANSASIDGTSITKYVCSSVQWPPNQIRTFEINVDQSLDDISLVSISNTNLNDVLCIDGVTINDKAATYLSANSIGGESGIYSLTAITKYPVCATEVVGVRIDQENSKTNVLSSDSTISGLECSNNNRLISSTCSISQSYELSKSTSFSISNEDSKISEYSWGSASSIAIGHTRSQSSSYGETSTNSQSLSQSSSQTQSSSSSQSVSAGAAYSSSFGGSYSRTISNEFSWSSEQKRKSGGFLGIGGSYSGGSKKQWTSRSESTSGFHYSRSSQRSFNVGSQRTNSYQSSSGTEQTYTSENSISRERSYGYESSNSRTYESNRQNSASSSATSGSASSWETTETMSVECSAEIEVPPSHSIQYSLIFDAVNTTINTFTDLKLTLCSAFLNPETADDESHYIYIDDIPGVLTHRETRSCTVQFEPAEYIRNDMTCFGEQRLAFSSGSNYVPRCQVGNTSLYDGCQCDIGDSGTLAQCMCADDKGNILPNKLAHVEGDDPWQKVCVEDLQCENSAVEYKENELYTDLTCIEAQNAAVSSKDINIPRCQESNVTYFDGCQCDLIDTITQCKCVDQVTGNMIPNKFLNMEAGDSWERLCAEELQCENSDVKYIVGYYSSDVGAAGGDDTGDGFDLHDDNLKDEPIDFDLPPPDMIGVGKRTNIVDPAQDEFRDNQPLQLIQSVAISMFALMAVVVMAFYLMKNAMSAKQAKADEFDEERVPMKQDMD